MSAPRRLFLLAAKLGCRPQTLAMQWAGIDTFPLGGHLRFPLRSFCLGERMENETSEQGDISGENSALSPPPTPTLPHPPLYHPFPPTKLFLQAWSFPQRAPLEAGLTGRMALFVIPLPGASQPWGEDANFARTANLPPLLLLSPTVLVWLRKTWA